MPSRFHDAFDGWNSFHACFLALINFVLAVTLLAGASASGTIVSAAAVFHLFQFLAFVIFCIPLFFICIGLGISGAVKRETFAIPSLLLTLGSFGFAIFITVIYPAQREQQRLGERPAPPTPLPTLITGQSPVVRFVQHPWFIPSCASILAVGSLLYFTRRFRSGQSSDLGHSPAQNLLPTSISASCPQCGFDLTATLASHRSVCPNCSVTLVASRRSAPEPPSALKFHDLISMAPFPLRLLALLLIGTTIAFFLIATALALTGNWHVSRIATTCAASSLFALLMLRFLLKSRYS